MNDMDRERAVPDSGDGKKSMEVVIGRIIGLLGSGQADRSTLVFVEDLLRNGQLTPNMTERWATVKSKVVELAANKELNDRARRRARIVLEKMEKMAPPSC